MTHTYLNRHAEVRRNRGALPLPREAKITLVQNLQAILRKLQEYSSDLFAAKMEELVRVVEIWRDLERKKGSKDPGVRTQILDAQQFIGNQALEFIDGPLLFNAFGSLHGHLRQVLHDLSLPLEEIRELATALEYSKIEDLDQYNATKEEAKLRTAEILRRLNRSAPTRDPATRSYDDVEFRNLHDRRLEEELATQTADDNDERVSESPSDQNALLTTITALAGNLTQSNVTITCALDKMTAALQSVSQNVRAQEPPHENAITDVITITDANTVTSADRELAEPQQNDAVITIRQENQHKINVQSERDRQKKDAYYKKVEDRFQAYDKAIEQLKAFHHGGPGPTNLVDLQVPDVQACYYRLVQIWKDLGVQKGYDIDRLRTHKGTFYKFAIGMREAHFILHLLPAYGNEHTELRNTGWSLNHMRWLQSDMTPYAFDIPFVHSKLDVDIICHALEKACPGQERFERPLKAADELPVSPQQTVVPQSYVLAPAVHVPQPAPVVTQMHHGQSVLPVVSHVNNAPTSAPAPIPQNKSSSNSADVMEVDNICEAFRKRGCPNFDNETCPMQHPDHLRSTIICWDIENHGICPFGNGCQFSHIVPAVTAVPQVQNIVSAGAATNVQTEIPVDKQRAPSGKLVDANVRANYCDNWRERRCANRKCQRLHLPLPDAFFASRSARPSNVQPGFENVNHFQKGGQAAQPEAQAQQGSNKNTPCKFFEKGICTAGNNCEWSHDPEVFAAHRKPFPPVVQQPFGDVTMGSAVSNGNSRSTTAVAPGQPSKYDEACQNEARSERCNSDRCWYTHSNQRSKNFGKVRPAHLTGARKARPQGNSDQHHQQGNLSGGQGGHGGQRAPNDYTFTPTQHNLQQALAQQGKARPPNILGWQQNVVQPQRQPVQPQGQGQDNTRPNGGSGQGPKCYVCGQTGHKKDVCPQKGSNQGGGNGGGQAGNCYSCGQPGHYSRNCPQSGGNQGGRNGGTHAPSVTTFL